jgi:hypothetical protein
MSVIMRRAVVAAVAALSAGACSQSGTYKMTWSFVTGEDAASGCGAHGVQAVRITGVTDAGSSDEIVAPCSAGELTRGVSPGNWTLTAHMLDGRNRPLGADAPADQGPVTIGDGTTTDLTAVFTPLPECGDGVDNDRDGRVDLDDPDCHCDATGLSESGMVTWVPCTSP